MTRKKLATLTARDLATVRGGSQNQKIQEQTFNLQQIQQTLNRVNETVTN